VIENFSYTYDVLGNVLTRADANESLTETLTYDNLNRLTQATASASIAPVKTFTYDPNGNQTAGLGRGISCTSYNKPSSITQGRARCSFPMTSITSALRCRPRAFQRLRLRSPGSRS
jgi:RHS Repeat